MDQKESVAASPESRQVAEENIHLKSVLCSVMKENQELRGRMRSSSLSRFDTTDEQAGAVLPFCR